MQSRKVVNNPESNIFNIRKVSKKQNTVAKVSNDLHLSSSQAEEELPNFPVFTQGFDARKQKQRILDQSVNEAIINSKVYQDLKKVYLENKRKSAEQKLKLQQQLEARRKQKTELLNEKDRLANEKPKYLEAIRVINEKLQVIRQTNERYRQALNNRITGEADYISNLIMSMKFQAEYEHDIDPDQMTYEQLLQLQQKIGVVSKGLPKHLIKLLPRTQVLTVSEQKCMVCFSNYEIGQVSTKITNCKHQFHFECLESWLGKEKVCPICKQEINIQQE